jgi:hypothetical protein
MQPTEIQVQRCLRALEEPHGAGVGTLAPLEDPEDLLADEVPDGLIALLTDTPAMRLERMADARMRLAAGDHPTDDDLAARLVGRLVCDRIR